MSQTVPVLLLMKSTPPPDSEDAVTEEGVLLLWEKSAVRAWVDKVGETVPNLRCTQERLLNLAGENMGLNFLSFGEDLQDYWLEGLTSTVFVFGSGYARWADGEGMAFCVELQGQGHPLPSAWAAMAVEGVVAQFAPLFGLPVYRSEPRRLSDVVWPGSGWRGVQDFFDGEATRYESMRLRAGVAENTAPSIKRVPPL